MSDSDSESDMDIDFAAEEAMGRLLPIKSKHLYEKTFNEFKDWCTKKKIVDINEKALLVYFNKEMEKKSPSSTWSKYSMLKSTLNCHLNIDISSFNNLKALLKRKSDGYRPNKSKTFSKNEIVSFLQTAEDGVWLPAKVSTILFILFQ